jgi:cell division protein FtsQ
MKILSTLFNLIQARKTRIAVRSSAVIFLGATIVHGIMLGGQLSYEGSPWLRIPDKLSSLIGLAADDIKIIGLAHHDPELLLHALNVKPGGSLLGFDAGQARHMLEGMDWVAAASVQRKFPNTLEIVVSEREAFAIWQRGTNYYLIDKAGVAMGGLDFLNRSQFLLVSGEEANLKVAELVNHLEATPELRKKVSAAALVGKRRWTLYLANGVKIALPTEGVSEALAKAAALDASQNILSKGIRELDFRIAGQMTVAISEIEEPKTTASIAKVAPKKN